jgi:hypothetical protein
MDLGFSQQAPDLTKLYFCPLANPSPDRGINAQLSCVLEVSIKRQGNQLVVPDLPQSTIHVAVEDRYLQGNAGATASSPPPSYPGIQLDVARVTKRWIDDPAVRHGKLDGGSPATDRINQLRRYRFP